LFRGARSGTVSRRGVYAVLAMILLASVIWLSRGYVGLDRVEQVFEGNDSSAQERLSLWSASLDLASNAGLSNALVGFGSETLTRLISAPTVDNFYLDHLLSEGVIGLAVFVATVFSPLLMHLHGVPHRSWAVWGAGLVAG